MTVDSRFEDRLRRDLAAIAVGVDTAVPAPPRRRRRRFAIAGAAIALPVALAAGAVVSTGPEYVDRIPAETIVAEGAIDGSRYLLVETRRTLCGAPVEGLEIVEEDDNIIGREWNTSLLQYGEPGGDCGMADPAPWLVDPARYSDGGVAVGDSLLWGWSVHPSVTTVRITTADGAEDLPVYSIDGAGYAVYEIPVDLSSFTVDLVVGDDVVPGAREVQTVPELD